MTAKSIDEDSKDRSMGSRRREERRKTKKGDGRHLLKGVDTGNIERKTT